ncbi:MAG: aminotransferase class V-fold PLP-dependent enzyme [Pyrinomonadaceae bacterium]
MGKDKVSRRQFIGGGIALGGSLALAGAPPANAEAWRQYTSAFSALVDERLPAAPLRADDEAGWRVVAKNYSVTRKITNLENAYWGIMAAPVLAEFKRLAEFINNENSFFARLRWIDSVRGIRETVARFLDVGIDEIAITRSATESLQALIGGYNELKPGDTVLYADLDYAEMKTAMRWLETRRNVKPVMVRFPEPTADEPLTEDRIVSFYEKALSDNPGTRLLLLTHVNNLTGMMIPVARIAKMAKQRGADVIVDTAHSVGQVDFRLKDLGCDFVGFNLHKWVGAPIGCGVIYINKSRIGAIDPYMGRSANSTAVTDRVDTGTVNFAVHMAIPAAIEFHKKIGTAAKEARLRHLRNLWVGPARKMKGVTILTPDDTSMVAGITSFRLNGVTTAKANDALMKLLAEKFGILTVRRSGPAGGDCIRVTPGIYNSPDDVMKLAKALREITASSYSF